MPDTEFTPGPEYVPPRGMPPLSFIGLALTVVMLSKQRVKVTIGTGFDTMIIELDDAGLEDTQERFDVMTQRMLSPGWGEKEKVGELFPALTPLTFH